MCQMLYSSISKVLKSCDELDKTLQCSENVTPTTSLIIGISEFPQAIPG